MLDAFIHWPGDTQASSVISKVLFSSNASHYWRTAPFRAKMLLLLLAGINMMVFHAITNRSVEVWGHQAHPPRAAKISGAASLGLWIGVVSLGRWIGFV